VKPSFIVQQQTQLFLFKYNKPDDVNILSQKFLTIKVEQFSLSKLPVNFKEAARGNSELLELRLLETGFLSRFQLNP
jgi:hypothetical protein